MSSKRDIERELIYAEVRGDSLQTLLDAAQADREELRSQVTKLQDALVAARAPEAYRDQQIAKEEENRIPLSAEQIERNQTIQKTTDAFLSSMEKPLFTSPDDMDDLLARSLMRNVDGPASLHGNNES